MRIIQNPEEVNRAIDEAVRVTKPGGVIFFAFISVYAIMYANYLQGNWAFGQKENFTEDYRIRHFKEQLFIGYDVIEFEQLFETKPVEWITTAGVDGLLEPIEDRNDFSIPDEDFEAFAAWYLHFSLEAGDAGEYEPSFVYLPEEMIPFYDLAEVMKYGYSVQTFNGSGS